MAFYGEQSAASITMASEPFVPRIFSGTTNGSSRFTEENYTLLQAISLKIDKIMQTCDKYGQISEGYKLSRAAKTEKIVGGVVDELRLIQNESKEIRNEEQEEDSLDVFQLFDETPQRQNRTCTMVGELINEEMEDDSLNVYRMFDESPENKTNSCGFTFREIRKAEQEEEELEFYQVFDEMPQQQAKSHMMFKEDYLQVKAEERFVRRHPEMLPPLPEPPDITSLGGEKLINIEEYLFIFPINVVSHASRFTTEFLQPSIVRQLMPIREACHVALQKIHPTKQRSWKHGQARRSAEGQGPDHVLQIVSYGSELSKRGPTFDRDLSDFTEEWHNMDSGLKAIGLTNQRETTVIWSKSTGCPLYNAIVWMDVHTSSICKKLEELPGGRAHCTETCGLPISTYFSALKVLWLLDNVDAIKEAVRKVDALFGIIDTWLIWNLTGGKENGLHVTDVSSASRTMLMNLKTLDWAKTILNSLGIPAEILPKIVTNAEIIGDIGKGWPITGIPIAGCLGDQHAAMVGQVCRRGEAKSTYGTGAFILLGTGDEIIQSKHRLLSTLAYKLAPKASTNYALERSIAIAGAAVQWLRDSLGVIKSASEIEALAMQVESTREVYFVPEFNGLFAPWWRDDARGFCIRITRFTNKSHIARAVLENMCFQVKDVLDSMHKDAGENDQVKNEKGEFLLRVEGGATVNNLLMQIQADLLGNSVVRPVDTETTALGAAYAAGIAIGVWKEDEIFSSGRKMGKATLFHPILAEGLRKEKMDSWCKNYWWRIRRNCLCGWQNYLKGNEQILQIQQRYKAATGHTGELYTAACSPTDPTFVALEGGDDKGFLWKINRGDWAFELQGHQDSVSSLSISSDGQLLASGSLDGVVKVWDIASGSLRCTLDGSAGGIEWVKWHPRGRASGLSFILQWRFPSSLSVDGTARAFEIPEFK